MPFSSAPAVSAIIPTTGRSPWLSAIVRALRTDPAVAEILIVDDRPSPNGPLTVLEAQGGRLRVVRSASGQPAIARQCGVEAARAPIVLLLDDDVVPAGSLATGHARRHAETSGLVVVGSMPVAAGDDRVTARLYAADYERRARTWANDPSLVLQHLWTGNISLRREDALRVGLASQDYSGRRHEDREFGLRCAAAGLRGVYAPELRAAHHYERELEAFFADAYAQGRERVDLHALHPELGPLTLDHFLENVPRPLRPVVSLAARPDGARFVRNLLDTAGRMAAAAGAGAAELRLAQIRRRAEQIDGAARRRAERRDSGLS